MNSAVKQKQRVNTLLHSAMFMFYNIRIILVQVVAVASCAKHSVCGSIKLCNPRSSEPEVFWYTHCNKDEYDNIV